MNTMNLKIMLPTDIILDESVTKIIAEAENGSFCLLPRHIDFVAALAPGIFTFVDTGAIERYAALNNGMLVKHGLDVLVSATDGVLGDDLENLNYLVEKQFLSLDEQQRTARSALARLEAGVIRHFTDLETRLHE